MHRCGLPAEDVDSGFIRRHHNGHIRYLANELSAQSSIQPFAALFSEDCRQRLEEAVVTAVLLTKASPGHF